MKKTFSELKTSSLSGRHLLWSASLLSLCVLPACSDSDDDLPNGRENVDPELTTSQLAVNADAATQAQRVTNFRVLTRAVAEEETGTVETVTDGTLPAEIPAGKTYVATGELKLSEGTTLTIKGGLKSEGTIALPGVTVVVEGGTLDVASLIAPTVVVNSGTAKLAKVLIAQSATINGGAVTLAQDASFPKLTIGGEAEVTIASGATVEATELNINAATVKIANAVADKKYSYIETEALNLKENDLLTNFGYGYIALQANQIALNGDTTAVASDLLLPSSLQLSTNLKEYKEWKVATTPETILEQTAIVKNATPAEGEDAVSATGIAVNGNDVYVSFHTYGANIKGAIDKATILSDGSIDAENIKTYTSTAANPFEFNYITVASNGKIYAVGSISTTVDENGVAKTATDTQKGNFGNGVIGVIDGTTLSTRKLYGGDGNGIILNGDYLQVASTYGLETYVADGLRREKAVATDGHAKSIVKSGSNVVVLSYDGNEATSTAYTDKTGAYLTETGIALSSYSSYDYTFETPTAISSISGVIVPTAGKNTVAVDNDVYYVAAGATGLLASNGKSFQVKRNDKNQTLPAGYANCVAVDNNYVYVAYGSAGVYVLDKNLKEVASYKNAGGKSANFVAVSNGKIFVAYGKDSWQVLQLATISK
jgi:aspartate 1-decarboxylase